MLEILEVEKRSVIKCKSDTLLFLQQGIVPTTKDCTNNPAQAYEMESLAAERINIVFQCYMVIPVIVISADIVGMISQDRNAHDILALAVQSALPSIQSCGSRTIPKSIV